MGYIDWDNYDRSGKTEEMQNRQFIGLFAFFLLFIIFGFVLYASC